MFLFRTKFFMHGDYQLAYCPIAQIVSFAFRDGAFVNKELTPELIWRLRVPKHTSSLPLRWKPEVLNTPILRRFERTPYGHEVHESLSMTYESSRQALKELGRDAKFEDDIGHYNFRRWTANEVNRQENFVIPIDVDEQLLGNFTSQERQRVLGQSGDAVFEKHYQSQFIGRDLQHVVLLRPSQEGLIRFAGSMLRKLSNTHKRAICQNPDLLQLRREKRELGAEMRSLAGSIKKARVPFPHPYQKHENVNKEIAKLRKRLATDTREAARKDHFQNAPVIEIDKQIKQLLGNTDEASSEAPENEDSGDETWELPTPNYVFAERARLVENFYGPDAENFDEDKLLARHTQVTKDMVVLLRLSEPSRRGNRVNWNIGDEDDDLLDPPEESPPLEEDTMNCPTNMYRLDSLRRHLIDTHLQHARNGISCNWKTCRDVPLFSDITKFLAHASTEHSYDIKIKLCHLLQASQTSCSDVSSREASPVSENRQNTKTPTSPVDLEMKNIDPRLLEAHPVPVAMALQTQPVTEVLSTSGGSSHPNSAETPIR
ncbi:hypothetical protein N7488_007940 [Penicillium malachiteum]|nr:hypothetical protein N7488_007940 [Penicillium malachiteum]